MDYSTPGFPVHHHLLSLLKFTYVESVMPSSHLILCRPLLLLPSIFPSIRVSYSESALRIRWPKYCTFSFSISPSSEYSELISFRIDWSDLLVVQGTLTSLPQFKNINSCVLYLIYGPTLTSVHDCWKDHSLNYTDLRQQKQDLKLTVAQIISSS